VFIETTEKSFLPQANVVEVFLTQQIESHVPHHSHIFGGILLADTGMVFIELHVQGLVQFVLNIPMLTHQRHAGGGRPYQTGNGDAVGTRDRRLLRRPTNRFHDNHRLEAKPLRQLGRVPVGCA
jgi:hypothetical protein